MKKVQTKNQPNKNSFQTIKKTAQMKNPKQKISSKTENIPIISPIKNRAQTEKLRITQPIQQKKHK